MRSIFAILALVVCATSAQAHGYGVAVIRQRVVVPHHPVVAVQAVYAQPVVVAPVVQQYAVQQFAAPVCSSFGCGVSAFSAVSVGHSFGVSAFRSRSFGFGGGVDIRAPFVRVRVR